MNCPKCSAELRRGKVRGTEIELDQCQGCGGLWLDDGELGTMLGPNAAGQVEIPARARESQSAKCPRCGTGLAWFTYPGTTTVVDACRQCRGVWLDAGEGKALRAQLTAPGGQMTCPKCLVVQPKAESCVSCGIIVARFRGTAAPLQEVRPKSQSAADDTYADIGGVKGSLLRFIDGALGKLLG